MNLGERYKALRLSVKDESGQPISIKDFASNCVNLQSPRISELENNRREMSLTELKAYHNYFKVSFEYLMGETDVTTIDDKVKAACEITGLNEEAVNAIAWMYRSKNYVKCDASRLPIKKTDVLNVLCTNHSIDILCMACLTTVFRENYLEESHRLLLIDDYEERVEFEEWKLQKSIESIVEITVDALKEVFNNGKH